MKKTDIKRDKEFIKLYLVDKLTYQAIGDKFNITRERVRQVLSKYNVKARSTIDKCGNHARADKLKKEILKDYKLNNLTVDKLHKKFNIPRYIISKVLQKELKVNKLYNRRR